VSALDVSSKVDGLVITGSADRMVKVWSTKNGDLKCLCSKDLNIGKVFAASFSPDSDMLVSVAGSKGTMSLWNLEGNSAVRRAVMGENSSAMKNVKEFTTLPDDEDEDEDDNDKDMLGMNMDED
jgi:periodic tryptophan protein 1